MKRLTTFLLALMLTWIGANAQTDYSYKMSTLSVTDNGWTNAALMDWGVERYEANGCSAGKVMYQTIEGLPAGTYTVKFYAFARIARDNALPTADTQSTIAYGYAQAGSNEAATQALTIPLEYTAGHAGWTDDDIVTLTVTLTEGESLEYGIQNATAGGQWYGISAISLFSDATPAAQSFEVDEEVESCVAEIDHWKITGNHSGGAFHQNTWSSEGNTDGSGMVTPFIEYWLGSGSLDDAAINHYQLGGLPKGLYTISVDARLYEEGNTTDEIVSGDIYFTANEEQVDLTTGTHSTSGSNALVYGTYTLVAEVTEAGTLDIGFSIAAQSNCDWVAFKNLKVVYNGESLPDLTYVTGDMNATVEATMKAAVDAYNTSKNTDDYTAALAAIEAAEESVAQYAEIAALVAALDETGAAVWASTTSGQAYTAKSLTTSDDISEDMAAAQIAQTTENSDMSYVLTSTGSWTAAQGNGPGTYGTGTETYCDPQVTAQATTGKVLYKTVTGLQAGTYSVSFYAAANHCNGITGASGDNLTQVYANNATAALTVGTLSGITLGDDYLYTLTCTVIDGTLEFGIENIASPCGNWYVCQAVSLTLTSLGADVEAGEEVHDCTAEFAHWTQTYTGSGTNGTYAYNDWSTESDASGMVTPFLQTWVYQDVLSDQTIDHNQLTGLPQGWYSVTVDARIMSETGEAITGTATLTANSDYIYIISDGSDGSYNGEAEEYGTYTVQCYVDEAGTLDIGFTIANANFNWLAWKNLSVVYLGETVEYNVGEATASETTVSPGETVTLTFADCTKGDEDATLGVSSSANVTFGETSVTLTTKGTITFTFDVPNVTESGEYTLTIPQNTIVWTLNGETKAGNAQQTITFNVNVPATIEEGEYLIVDADGNYLGGGQDYGTHATSIGKPQFIGFEKQDDGTYHLDSHQYNNASAHYLGANLYFDNATPVDWTLVKVEGGYAIYGTVNDGTGYLTSNGFQELATVESTPYTWTLVTMDEIVKNMAAATEEKPVDVTALIKAPELKHNSNSTYYPTWTVTGYDGTGTPSNYAFGGGNAVANCAESYHSTNGFNFSQEITLPLAGTYKLSAQAFYSGTPASGEALPVLYAGDDTSEFPALTDETITTMAPAYQAFLEDSYPVGPITITTYSSDETVTIGFKGVGTSTVWNIMGELDLQYLGVVEETVTWTMTDANWGTLILPFAVTTVPDGLTAYAGDALTIDGSTITVGEEATSIAANTPYLIKGSVSVDTDYEFTGTPVEVTNGLTSGLLTGTYKTMYYDDLMTAAGSNNTVYLLQNHDETETDANAGDGLGFYPVVTTGESSEATLTANHCYLTLSSASGVRAYIGLPDSGEATGIVAVESDMIAGDAIYDLSGRKVSKAVKGVYIQNGKKVLVK